MSRLDRPLVAVLLIAVAALVELSYVYANTFSDESDVLFGGWLIARGAVLYRDIFSHHFPLAYYWVGLVVALFGRSVLAVRVSVIAFQLACLALTARVTRLYLAVGLVAVLWALVGYLYFANLAVYPSFKGPALLVVFVTTLVVTGRGSRLGRGAAVAIGTLAAIATLADPLSIYPIGLAFLAMRLAGQRIGELVAATAVPLVGFVVYLVATGSARDFYADTIAFNANIYARFSRVGALPIGEFLTKLVQGLGIIDPSAFGEGFTLRAPSSGNVGHWLFTGFLPRAALVVLTLSLLLHRKPLAAGFVYLFAASLLATWGEKTFRSLPFVMTGLTAGVLFALGAFAGAPRKSTIRMFELGTRALTAAALLALTITLASSLVVRRKSLSYAANFARYENDVRSIRRLTCDRPEVAFAAFPYDSMPNFIGGFAPVSRQIYLLPWNAPAGIPEVIAGLGAGDAVVVVKKTGSVWGLFKNRDFLAPLIAYLDANYKPVNAELYVSRALHADCPGTEPAAAAPAQRR